MASGPQASPGGQVPLQNGWVASPHGWLPSGTQPQYGGKSEMGAHVSPASHAPPQENGPPPHDAGRLVVVVEVVVGVQPLGPQASQQLVNALTHAWPPLGAVQADTSRRTSQRVRPEARVRQHATAPGRPHVDARTHRRTLRAHSVRSPPAI